MAGQRYFHTVDAVLRVQCLPVGAVISDSERQLRQSVGPLFLQVTPATVGQSVGTVSDASLSDGHKGWALVTADQCLHHLATGDPAQQPADVLELEPIRALLERDGPQLRGKLVWLGTDNIVNMFRLIRGRAAPNAKARKLLQLIYELADANGVDFIAVWIPRSANQFLDALAKCRTTAEAGQLARANGLRFFSL